MKTLVIAPHPDDETIGCGGTLALGSRRGDSATVAFLTSGELGLEELPPQDARAIREGEAEAAASILGITSLSFLRHPDWYLEQNQVGVASDLARIVDKERPDTVLVPHPEEWHPDHAVAAGIVSAALQLAGATPTLGYYEVWTPLTRFDWVEDVSSVMTTKLSALAAYRSQLAKFRYDDAVEGLDRFRGALAARCRYAEVFYEATAT
jgi:LmbE family N-acetylglucosaminyl deacetylase